MRVSRWMPRKLRRDPDRSGSLAASPGGESRPPPSWTHMASPDRHTCSSCVSEHEGLLNYPPTPVEPTVGRKLPLRRTRNQGVHLGFQARAGRIHPPTPSRLARLPPGRKTLPVPDIPWARRGPERPHPHPLACAPSPAPLASPSTSARSEDRCRRPMTRHCTGRCVESAGAPGGYVTAGRRGGRC